MMPAHKGVYLKTLKEVTVRREPYTRLGSNPPTPMPGWIKVASVDVEVDWTAIEAMAQRAVRNKSGRCKAGPLTLKVVARTRRTTELPAQPLQPANYVTPEQD
jgi:hypothetical protein